MGFFRIVYGTWRAGGGIVPRAWPTSHGPKTEIEKEKHHSVSKGYSIHSQKHRVEEGVGAVDTKDTLKFFGTSSVWKRTKCDSLNRFPYIHNALTAKNAYVSPSPYYYFFTIIASSHNPNSFPSLEIAKSSLANVIPRMAQVRGDSWLVHAAGWTQLPLPWW